MLSLALLIIINISLISQTHAKHIIHKKVAIIAENQKILNALENYTTTKGGSIAVGLYGTFNSINFFSEKGIRGKGLALSNETLMRKSLYENTAYYPLIAEYMEEFDENIIVHINPNAKWQDNSPITADDIVFSFYELINNASPAYKVYYKNIEKVEKIDNLSVNFIFENEKTTSPFIIAEMPVINKKFHANININTELKTPFIGSGPYTISSFEPGQYITYKRNENYWGEQLPINKNQFNFDYVTFKYYQDETILLRAFKTQEIDAISYTTAEQWNKVINMKEVKSGDIVYNQDKNDLLVNMSGIFINTRKEQFKDVRVRKALNYAFDFKWYNKNFFNNQHDRMQSYFENSLIYKLDPIPQNKELELLQQYKDRLPKELFTTPFISPNTLEPESIEENLKKAMDLLYEAGWEIKNHKLINKNGNQFKIEIIDSNRYSEKFLQNFANNLKKLGIDAEVKILDKQNYYNKLYNLNYDLTFYSYKNFNILLYTLPLNFHSKHAYRQGSKNFSGIDNKIIDELIEKILALDLTNIQSIKHIVNALDRVMLWEYYTIPSYYKNSFYIAYWNKFNTPTKIPPYGEGLSLWSIPLTN